MAWSPERVAHSFEWSNLTKLGKNRIIQSSYVWLIVVPAVAKALEPLNMLGQDQTFDVFGTTLTLHVGLPFSWKVFYVSALFLSGSSLLYQIFCPRLIKDLDGKRHATGDVGAPALARYAEMMGMDPGGAVRNTTAVWDFGEKRSTLVRVLCGVGYLIGLTLIAWVVGQGVLSVFPLIFS